MYKPTNCWVVKRGRKPCHELAVAHPMGPGIFTKELRTLVAVLPAKRSTLLEQAVPYTCTAAKPVLNCFTSSDFKVTGPQIPFGGSLRTHAHSKLVGACRKACNWCGGRSATELTRKLPSSLCQLFLSSKGLFFSLQPIDFVLDEAEHSCWAQRCLYVSPHTDLQAKLSFFHCQTSFSWLSKRFLVHTQHKQLQGLFSQFSQGQSPQE